MILVSFAIVKYFTIDIIRCRTLLIVFIIFLIFQFLNIVLGLNAIVICLF